MPETVAPPVSRPVNVALVIEVGDVRVKSSADSISNGAPVAGRDALAPDRVNFPTNEPSGGGRYINIIQTVDVSKVQGSESDNGSSSGRRSAPPTAMSDLVIAPP
jgi:hypothetical protein